MWYRQQAGEVVGSSLLRSSSRRVGREDEIPQVVVNFIDKRCVLL